MARTCERGRRARARLQLAHLRRVEEGGGALLPVAGAREPLLQHEHLARLLDVDRLGEFGALSPGLHTNFKMLDVSELMVEAEP